MKWIEWNAFITITSENIPIHLRFLAQAHISSTFMTWDFE